MAQLFRKIAQKVETVVQTINDPLLNSHKSQQSFGATFVSKFVAENIQKSANLVTLISPITTRSGLSPNYLFTALESSIMKCL